MSQGIRVQRARLRNCLKRVDPIGRRLRSITTIRRRVYNVRSPLALWHMDGNHKLIRLAFEKCLHLILRATLKSIRSFLLFEYLITDSKSCDVERRHAYSTIAARKNSV